MQDNPYAAPTTLVEDAAPLPKGTPPRHVLIGMRLLWLSFGLSTVAIGVSLAGMPTGETATVATALTFAALLALTAWLNVCTARGRNWARIVVMLLTVVSVVAWPFIPADPTVSAFEWALDLSATALSLAAICLLFTRSAAPWFR